MCVFFYSPYLRFARTCVCAPYIVGSHPRQNGLVAMNVALQHWATVILPLKSNSRSSIYFCTSSVEKKKDSQMRIFLFCCQTRIRRSACAYCNDCCFAALGNRTSSLSPSKQSLVGTPIRWVLIHEFRNKIRTSNKEILILLPN